jgi:N-acyl-D-amino-acid deacylase
MGESSAGPLSEEMRSRLQARLSSLEIAIDWTTLGGYLQKFENGKTSVNVAAFVGANTIRTAVLGEADVQPNPEQLAKMRGIYRPQQR